MLKRRGLIHRGQRGFTLVEMLVVVALVGIIAAGIAMTISQVMAVNSRTSSKMVALRQVQQAGDRVSRDVLQSRGLNWTNSDFSLTLTIPYWSENTTGAYKVVFWLAGDELKREYYSSIDGAEPDYTTVIARYIDADDTSFEPNLVGDGYVFRVSATVGLYTETREYEIKPRPSG
ncbi:MAG: type II secretion system protein J [Dehalococcoidia bacterium]